MTPGGLCCNGTSPTTNAPPRQSRDALVGGAGADDALPNCSSRYEFDRHFVNSDSETDTPDYTHEFDRLFADLDVRAHTNPLPPPACSAEVVQDLDQGPLPP